MRSLILALRQVTYENKAFWRNPPAAFFTVVFPLMFLVVFNLLFGNYEMTVQEGTTPISTFYIPAVIVLSIISASYTNVAMRICISREQGVLKRVRGTPLPGWAFLFGRIAHGVVISVLLVTTITLCGFLFLGVNPNPNTILPFVCTLVIGATTFSALGVAVTVAVPNADSAPAIVNASVLPLLFISNVFIPMHFAPQWINLLANIFPISHFSAALQTSFNPYGNNAGFEVIHLGFMCLWMLLGVLVAIRFFSWDPRK